MKALVITDKNTDDVKMMMKFYYGFTPNNTVTVGHYHELSKDHRDSDDVLIHIQQKSLPLTQNYPLETYFEFLETTPYNQPRDWVKSFNIALISTIDDKSERYYQALHS